MIKIYFAIFACFFNSILIQAGCYDYYIKTPNNSNVKACTSGGYSSSQIQNADSYSRTFAISPSHVYEAGTNSYNCHGYAWHVKEGGNKVWINNVNSEANNLSSYWTDGSYFQYSYASQGHVENLKVFYENDDHTAITTSDPNVFVSKMGCGCLVAHHRDNSPYEEGSFTYYLKTTTPVIISGVSMVGGTSTASFSVNYIPNNSTLSWQYDTNLLTLVSSSARGIVVKPKTSITVGDATIIARIKKTNGDVNDLRYNVGVNGPHWTDVKLVVKDTNGKEVYPSGNGLCPNSFYYAYLTAHNGNTYLTDVNWGASSQLDVFYASNSELQFRTLSQGWGTLNISAKASYGITKHLLGVTLYDGSSCSNTYYSISLLPSSNILEIDFNMNNFNSTINESYYKKGVSFDIRIYNSISGTMAKQAYSSGENIQIDISNVSNGIYVVHIYDGITDKPQIQKISITH